MVKYTFLNLKKVLSEKMAETIDRGALFEILPQLYIKSTRKTTEDLKKRGLILVNPGSGKSGASEILLSPRGRRFSREVIKGGIDKNLGIKKKPLRFSLKQIRALKELEKIRAKQKFKWKYDQAPLTAESVILKASLAMKGGDVNGKSVVCIGDDDLVSMAIVLTGKPKEILVIDIDQDLLDMIKNLAKKTDVKVSVLKHDLRKPIPKKYRGKFDTFFTWPSETVLGISLFISRGAELLKKDGSGVGYMDISPIEFHPLELLSILENFGKMGMSIAEYTIRYGEGIYIAPIKNGFSVKSKLDLVKIKTNPGLKSIYRRLKGEIPY